MGNSVGWPVRATFWCLLLLFSMYLWGQDSGDLRPVPILTGSTGYFTRVTAGTVQDAPSFSPLLLVPLGEKWLVEAKGSLSDTFSKNRSGTYNGLVSYGTTYAQVDYIANPYVTVCAGRFTSPFGIYGERYAPNWIRALQVTPTTFGLTSGASLGGMLRGGFPAGTEKINFDYAVYFSTANTNHIVATDRTTGGRISFFLPGPRLEFGASFQQVLQLDRSHAAGVHFVWQPNRVPLSLRSEYVRTSGLKGGSYWIEAAYQLSQVPYLRRVEAVGRGQQFLKADNLSAATSRRLGALGVDTQQGDFGLNYYFRPEIRASASYGRLFAFGRNANLWTLGMTYRFLMPMASRGSVL